MQKSQSTHFDLMLYAIPDVLNHDFLRPWLYAETDQVTFSLSLSRSRARSHARSRARSRARARSLSLSLSQKHEAETDQVTSLLQTLGVTPQTSREQIK